MRKRAILVVKDPMQEVFFNYLASKHRSEAAISQSSTASSGVPTPASSKGDAAPQDAEGIPKLRPSTSEGAPRKTRSTRNMRENELPPDEVTTKKLRLDQARALVMTRRKRFGEFSIGGLVASAPGAIQTLVDWHADPKHTWPTTGHQIEIAFAFMFFTAVFISIFRFDDPIARDVLEEMFPEAAKDMGMLWRIGKVVRRAKTDFLGR